MYNTKNNIKKNNELISENNSLKFFNEYLNIEVNNLSKQLDKLKKVNTNNTNNISTQTINKFNTNNNYELKYIINKFLINKQIIQYHNLNEYHIV